MLILFPSLIEKEFKRQSMEFLLVLYDWKQIVSMVSSYASELNVNYLNLLPTKELTYFSQDTATLVDSFNRGYKDA